MDEGESSGITIDINISGFSQEQWSKFNFRIGITGEGSNLINIGKGEGYILENPSGYDDLIKISDEISQIIYDQCVSLDPDLCNQDRAYHVVIIESIEVEENYRKRGFGLETMRFLLTFFKGDLVIIVPCPMIGSCPKEDEDKVTEKLRQHWMKCGFKQMRDTDIFYFRV